MGEATVEAHGLRKAFGHGREPVRALDGLSLAVPAGSVLGLLAWSGGMLVVFAVLAVRSYARMGR